MSGTQAIDRAAELIALVVQAEGACSFTDLVGRTGLAKSTGSRLLQALERHHLLERADDGYRPGALFAVYAARHEPMVELERLATPVLRRLGERTGETVNLAVPRGHSVVQIAQVDSTYLLGATNWVGVEVPAHCTALGKVFYAFDRIALPATPLERRTARSPRTAAELNRQLATVRDLGFAVARGELEPGLDAVAAPIRGVGGQVIAALSVSGPDVRLADQLEDIGHLLVLETDTLSGLLGHRPTDTELSSADPEHEGAA